MHDERVNPIAAVCRPENNEIRKLHDIHHFKVDISLFLAQILSTPWKRDASQWINSYVGWGCRTQKLNLSREVRPPLNECPEYDIKPSFKSSTSFNLPNCLGLYNIPTASLQRGKTSTQRVSWI